LGRLSSLSLCERVRVKAASLTRERPQMQVLVRETAQMSGPMPER
jgi:hypothetical protein